MSYSEGLKNPFSGTCCKLSTENDQSENEKTLKKMLGWKNKKFSVVKRDFETDFPS